MLGWVRRQKRAQQSLADMGTSWYQRVEGVKSHLPLWISCILLIQIPADMGTSWYQRVEGVKSHLLLWISCILLHPCGESLFPWRWPTEIRCTWGCHDIGRRSTMWVKVGKWHHGGPGKNLTTSPTVLLGNNHGRKTSQRYSSAWGSHAIGFIHSYTGWGVIKTENYINQPGSLRLEGWL